MKPHFRLRISTAGLWSYEIYANGQFWGSMTSTGCSVVIQSASRLVRKDKHFKIADRQRFIKATEELRKLRSVA